MVHQDVPTAFITQNNPFMINSTYQNQIISATVPKSYKSFSNNSTMLIKTPLSSLMNDDNNNDTKYEKWLTKVDIEDTIQRISI